MLTCISVKASVSCPECSSQVPLNGLLPRLSCPTCQRVFAVEKERAWWEDVDEVDEFVGAACLAEPPREIELDWEVFRVAFLRRDLACPGCGAPIPATTLAAGIEARSCRCPSCQRPLEVRSQRSWQEELTYLRGVAGEAPVAVVEQRDGRALALLCPSCGGALAAIPGERTARCEYCETSSLTPDPQAARRQEWFGLVIDADEPTVERWRLRGLDEEERNKLAEDPSTPPRQLELLASFQWAEVLVAGNRSAPPDTLARLARSDERRARENVAGNPGAPPEALLALAGDEERNVREKLAARAALPAVALVRLARDEERAVRLAVAKREQLPDEVLRALATDSEREILRAVARRRALGAELLAMLAASEDSGTREIVARHKNTAPETLAKLAGDADASVRDRVARNPRTPGEALDRLARSDELAAESVRRNPSRPWWKKLFGR